MIEKSVRSKGTTLKLEVASSLKSAYDMIVVEKYPNPKIKSEDEKNLLKAYHYFKDRLQSSYADNQGNEKNRQDLLWKKLDNLLDSNLVLVTLEDEDDAYEVFEGFNARGVELSISDLFKNLFLQKIKGTEDDKARALDDWEDIVQIVRDLKVPKFTINTFLRYYWIRNHTFIGERQLYKRIKKDTTDYRKLLSEMHAVAGSLKVLFSGSAYDINDLFKDARIKYASSINNSIRALRVMNTQSYMVWLMSIVADSNRKHITPKLFASSIHQVEIFSFRYFAISKLPANRVEKLYANLSKKLFDLAKTEDSQRVCSLVSDSFIRSVNESNLLPKPDQFIMDFENLSLQTRNKSLIRYIFTKIEGSKSTGETVVDQESINIEHIMPQKPGKEWSLSTVEHKSNVNKIGNITILLEALNSSMSNKTIDQKITHFKKSDLLVNKQLVEMIESSGGWTIADIGQRQLVIAQEAEKIWSFGK